MFCVSSTLSSNQPSALGYVNTYSESRNVKMTISIHHKILNHEVFNKPFFSISSKEKFVHEVCQKVVVYISSSSLVVRTILVQVMKEMVLQELLDKIAKTRLEN